MKRSHCEYNLPDDVLALSFGEASGFLNGLFDGIVAVMLKHEVYVVLTFEYLEDLWQVWMVNFLQNLYFTFLKILNSLRLEL